MTDIRNTVREFILANYLVGESPSNLRDDTRLITSGILDSLATLGLAEFVEKQYGIELDVYDTAVERFDRIQDIAAVVASKAAR